MGKPKPGVESKPSQIARVVANLTPEEKANLDRLVAETGVTLSHAIRQGAKAYLEDVKRGLDAQRRQGRLDV